MKFSTTCSHCSSPVTLIRFDFTFRPITIVCRGCGRGR